MLDTFKEKVCEIYNLLIEPIDFRFKKTALERFMKELDIDEEGFGKKYYELIVEKKSKGVVYTPIEIAEYIVKNTIKAEEIIKNPYLRICDPSCGSGNILITAYQYLKSIYVNNLQNINDQNNISLSIESIDEHILKYNIFGFDIDDTALKILVLDLFCLTNNVFENIYCCDFLLDENEITFNCFIGNPPYVGQKAIDKDYSSKLKVLYKGVYKDKGDLSYCFFKKALMKLKKGGNLGFITSRYFLEAPSGEELRRILKQQCTINKIVDFYGIRPFKGIGIDPVILFITNKISSKYDINIIKPLNNKVRKKEFYKSVFMKCGDFHKDFKVNSDFLESNGWTLIDSKQRNIIKKIEAKCKMSLDDICDSYQGIITGCDKAFIVTDEVIKDEKLEVDIIKPWIKSSYIQKNYVNRQNSYIIYSNFIKDEKEYPEAIMHIESQKERLMKRRECSRGVRKWYELQWGRKSEIFEGEKIIFPYKSNNNRFSLDKGSYFSADVYCLILKEDTGYNYEILLFLLNSKLYEFYFKSFAKKLGEDIYEYYPNNLMKLMIPEIDYLSINKEEELFHYFDLNKEEIKIIENT